MRGCRYIVLCAAVATLIGGPAVAQEAEPATPETLTVEQMNERLAGAPTVEGLRERVTTAIVEEAEAENSAGRYQIESTGSPAMAWILDTKTGLLRVCGARLADPGAFDPMKRLLVTCSPWTPAGM